MPPPSSCCGWPSATSRTNGPATEPKNEASQPTSAKPPDDSSRDRSPRTGSRPSSNSPSSTPSASTPTSNPVTRPAYTDDLTRSQARTRVDGGQPDGSTRLVSLHEPD